MARGWVGGPCALSTNQLQFAASFGRPGAVPSRYLAREEGCFLNTYTPVCMRMCARPRATTWWRYIPFLASLKFPFLFRPHGMGVCLMSTLIIAYKKKALRARGEARAGRGPKRARGACASGGARGERRGAGTHSLSS